MIRSDIASAKISFLDSARPYEGEKYNLENEVEATLFNSPYRCRQLDLNTLDSFEVAKLGTTAKFRKDISDVPETADKKKATGRVPMLSALI